MADDRIKFVRIRQDVLDPGPLPVPFCDSTMGPFTHWKLDWMRLTADDGTVGEAPGAVHPLIRGALLDGQARSLDEWWHNAFWMLRNAGHRCPQTAGFLHAFDMAMRDILARRRGLAWHRFCGAARDEVPVYASGGGTNLSTEELVAQMAEFVDQGFTTLKMKVGTDFGQCPDRDVDRVRAVREAIGPGIALAIDGNQTWTAEQALRFAERVADFNIAWFEEPVHSADRAATREICRSCPFPVAMGESENHWLGFRDLIECGVGHPQPCPGSLPGFGAWSQAVDFAEQAGLPWSAGGFSHLTAMYVAGRDRGQVEYLAPIIAHLATCWSDRPRIEAGQIRLPADRPGLPVAVDWQGLARRGAVAAVLDLS